MTQLVPTAVITAVLVFGPGLAITMLAGLRGLAALALAPAVTYAAVGLGAGVGSGCGLAWGWPTAIIAWLVMAAVAGLMGRGRALHTPRLLNHWSRFQWGVVCAGAAAAFLVAAIRMDQGEGWARQPPAGQGGVFNDLADLLATWTTQTTAQQSMAWISGALVWIVAVVYLQRVAFPTRPGLALTGAVGAVLYQATPPAMSSIGLTAEACALALTPAILAWSIQLARVANLRSTGRNQRLAVLLVAVIGAGLAHRLGIIACLLVVLPPAVVLARRLTARRAGLPWRWISLGVALTGIGVAALVAALAMPPMQSTGLIKPGPYVGTPLALLGALTDWTPYFSWGPNLLVGGLVMGGLAVAVRKRRRQAWLAASFGLAWAWYAAAAVTYQAGPGLPPWYLDPAYLAPIIGIVGIPLASMAVANVADWFHQGSALRVRSDWAARIRRRLPWG